MIGSRGQAPRDPTGANAGETKAREGEKGNMRYAIEFDGQWQCECTTIPEGLCLIAEAEKNGSLKGVWAGIRADDGSGLAAEVFFRPVSQAISTANASDRQPGESDRDWQSRVRADEEMERLVAAAMRV